VHALARAVDAKDGYTHSHSQRVARYAAELGRALGLTEDRIEQVRTAGVLHDVGKIGIPDAVLLKPAKLDDSEFAVMRRHSELGRDIIAGAGLRRSPRGSCTSASTAAATPTASPLTRSRSRAGSCTARTRSRR
jgi:HD-GYP domain-containing protein (c-di-GMP phosphodiesterase class II)